jgi:hypothetical protein
LYIFSALFLMVAATVLQPATLHAQTKITYYFNDFGSNPYTDTLVSTTNALTAANYNAATPQNDATATGAFFNGPVNAWNWALNPALWITSTGGQTPPVGGVGNRSRYMGNANNPDGTRDGFGTPAKPYYTSYQFKVGPGIPGDAVPADNQYSITNHLWGTGTANVAGATLPLTNAAAAARAAGGNRGYNAWWNSESGGLYDHTTGGVNGTKPPAGVTPGNFLIFNAAGDLKPFFFDTVYNLTPQRDLYTSVWVMSMIGTNAPAAGTFSQSKIIFQVESLSGEILGSRTDIIPNKVHEWREYGIHFTISEEQDAVIVKVINAQDSTQGNDLAFDDLKVVEQVIEDPLPVSFGAISAAVTGHLLTVNWSTFTETNNSRFEVEASADGNHFTKINSEVIASKAVNGNSTDVNNYSFTRDITGLSGWLAVSVLAFAIGFVKRKRNRYILLAGVVGCLFVFGVACNKNHDTKISDTNQKLFIRIKQIDKDGGYTYSKVVQAVAN